MLKTLLKFIIGAFAVVGVLVCLVIGVVAWVASAKMYQTPKPPEKVVLVLDFREELLERADSGPDFHSLFSMVTRERNERMNLHAIVQALHRGSKDARVVGAVGLFGPNVPSLAQGQEIRTALEKFRASGKFTTAYSPSYGEFGPGNSVYYLASAFEKVWLQPIGNLGLSGMRIENPFARGALEKLGVKASFLQREEYKTAMSFVTEDKMPAPMREEMQGLLDSLSGQVVAGIASSRGMTPEQVKALMLKGPYTAQEALDNKLVDKMGYLDEIEKWIDETHGKKTARMGPEDYLHVPDAAGTAKPEPKATVAVIVAQGEISDSGARPSPLSGGASGMDVREVVGAFEDAVEDKDVKQIIFRIDSPGGSPVASETVRRAAMRAQQQGKKVIVSMGEMAGSGGYWIAMNADHIIADPATLTGSIGVLGGKVDLSGLYQKLGVNWDVLQMGPDHTGMWSTTHDFTPEEKARFDALLDDTYVNFRKFVSEARKIPMDKMPGVSKGRIFTGEQAVKLGLVDELGGMRAAIDYSKTSLGLTPDDLIVLKPFPKQVSTAEKVRGIIKEFFGSEALMPTFSISALQQSLERAVPPRLALMPQVRVE